MRIWTDAGEYLFDVSRETVRAWIIEAKLWRQETAHRESAPMARAARPHGRTGAVGYREHEWLEKRGDELYLISMIDDATSRPMLAL